MNNTILGSCDGSFTCCRSNLAAFSAPYSNADYLKTQSLLGHSGDLYSASDSRVKILTAESTNSGVDASSINSGQLETNSYNGAVSWLRLSGLEANEAESLSNEQLQSEYRRNLQISRQAQTEEQKYLLQSTALTQSQSAASQLNALSLKLKQSATQMRQCALAQITSGVALYASGAALEAAGRALAACPFSKAAGLAMISKGKALKQQGMAMQQEGKKLSLGAQSLLNSGLKLATSASQQLQKIAKSWQKLEYLYRQIKEMEAIAEKSMNCVAQEGQKRGLSMIVPRRGCSSLSSLGTAAVLGQIPVRTVSSKFSSDKNDLPSVVTAK
ncbi:MAG: hypothetical protein ACI376_05145 [Candidatus Bruticola sp.]